MKAGLEEDQLYLDHAPPLIGNLLLVEHAILPRISCIHVLLQITNSRISFEVLHK